LMTPIERADASTVWKEFTTPEGRKYYYNKVTKQSKWTIPDETRGCVARKKFGETGSECTVHLSHNRSHYIMTIEEEIQEKGLGFVYYSYGQAIAPNRGGPVEEIESR